ncbi:MAG: 30S ribosome-binding factor RbfA [Bacilli bacterium]|nr:30S ribosome-binding factor RbfA [Bacilli bacterium]
MNSIRVGRISSDVLRFLSSIMLLEAKDETLKHVTLTGCEVTNDLSYARVYYTYMGNEPMEDVQKNLEVAEPYLRTMLASKMKDLRKMPELKFIVDTSIEYGNNIEKILDDIKKDDE